MKKFYTPKEVAEMYNMHYMTIMKYINTGLFGVVRKAPGKTGRFKISEENLQTFDKNLLP
mgnify:FL=1|jgi:predicted site-specific integrase-resolvase